MSDILPVTVTEADNSSSSNSYGRRQIHGEEMSMTSDHRQTVTTTTTTTTSDADDDERSRSSLTLSFQLRGDVVELHLTRSNSQTSHGKVFVAERGRVRRWIPNDVR